MGMGEGVVSKFMLVRKAAVVAFEHFGSIWLSFPDRCGRKMATKMITYINVFEEAFPTLKASGFLWYHLEKGFLIFTELQSDALKEERGFDRDQDKPCYALHPPLKG